MPAPDDREDPVEVVYCTCPDNPTAARIAQALVAERLAACVNLLPGLRSFYRWEGAVHDDPETLLIIKTCLSRIDALTQRIQALHPYDVPEVLAVPANGGLPEYLGWVSDSTRAATAGRG